MNTQSDSSDQWVHIPLLSLRYLQGLARQAHAEGYGDPTQTAEYISQGVTDYVVDAVAALTIADGRRSNRESELLQFMIADQSSWDDIRTKLNAASKTIGTDPIAIPDFFEALVVRDRQRGSRESIDAMLAVYAIFVAFTVVDNKTSSTETAIIFDSYLKPLQDVVTDAGIASHREVEDCVYDSRSVASFCTRLESAPST